MDYLTNETVFSLTQLPRRFGVIGAGPIGAELAQSFARFGSDVTLVESQRGLMPNEDRDAAAVVRASMEKDGVRFVRGSREVVVSPAEDGAVRLKYDHPEEGYDIVVDTLLSPWGARRTSKGSGLEKAGVNYDKSGVQVDDHLRTSNPRIFAAGDISSRYKFTHAADFMARTVIRNALFKGRAKASQLIIPWSTYTSPELAHVGWTAAQAADKGVAVDTFTQPMSGVDRAILEGETEGFVRIHVRKGTAEIVGATIVGTNAGDLISQVAQAMNAKTGLGAIANVIHPYPTQAEAVRKVGDQYNRTRLTPRVKALFQKWLAWTR